MKVRGNVTQISRKEAEGQYGPYTKVGIKMEDGTWWNGIQKDDWDAFQEGDEVLLEVEENEKGYKNVVGLSNLSGTSGAVSQPKQAKVPDFKPANQLQESKKEVDWDGKERRMVRMNALAHADAHFQGRTPPDNEYFDFAQKCMDWVYTEPEKKIPGAQDEVGAFAQDEKKKVKK
jgi:hypothetical protein